MFEAASTPATEDATTTTSSVWGEPAFDLNDWPSESLLGGSNAHRVSVDPAIYGIEDDTGDVHSAAARGIASPTSTLPFFDQIQRSFGGHDISGINAHVGGTSASEMGAKAFAAGNHVVFDREPDLHTAAHEVAHVIQQARGVNLYGGVGDAGDDYERAADAVADRVVAGHSATDLLGAPTSALPTATSAVQRKEETGTLKARADGHRAHTISDHLRIGAMKIQAECDVVSKVIDGTSKDPEADMKNIVKPAFSRANDSQSTLSSLWGDMGQLSFRDPSIHPAFGIFNAAKRRLDDVTARAKQWAQRNHLGEDGVGAGRVAGTVTRFANALGVEKEGSGAVFGREDPKAKQDDLVKAAMEDSLLAVENSVEALSQAMREDDAKGKGPPLAERAYVDMRMLDISLEPSAITPDITRRIQLAAHVMQRAFRDSTTYGLDKSSGSMINANDLIKQIVSKALKPAPKKP